MLDYIICSLEQAYATRRRMSGSKSVYCALLLGGCIIFLSYLGHCDSKLDKLVPIMLSIWTLLASNKIISFISFTIEWFRLRRLNVHRFWRNAGLVTDTETHSVQRYHALS